MTLTAPSEAATVRIDAESLTIDEVVAIADGAPVELGPAAIERIRRSRAVVDAAVAGPALVYGLNTGLGHMRDERVSTEALREYQVATVVSHAGGIGPPLPTRIVRAAIAVRLAGIARGGAGASLGVAAILVELLNRRVHPVVPSIGSVGASDLAHMAAIASVAIGRGRAEVGGEELDGGGALARVGLRPVELEPKDGLVLISANGVAVGRAVLTLVRAERVAREADLAVACSLEAIAGNLSIVDPAAAAAKPVAGQIASAACIRALVGGSERCDPAGADSVQDPLSFRVAPQVHGAFREALAAARGAVDVELAAMDDNPLVVVDEDRLVSNGNFEPIALALAFDALRPALAHVGQLSERRMNHLWRRFFDTAQVFSADGMRAADQAPVGPLVRYSAATRYAALRGLASPASLDVPSLDEGQEDHATNAPEVVARTDEALDALEDILAVELAMAESVLRAAGAPQQLGVGTGAAIGALRDLFASLGPAPTSTVLDAVRDALSGPILAAADDAT